MKAFLKNYRQSPRKVRLVADYVRGKKIDDALVRLQFLPKRASRTVAKLIKSAKANAENNFKVATDDLVIKEIRVDEGVTLKRFRPVSRGRAHRINKRTSHIQLVLGMADDKKKKAVKEEKAKVSKKKATETKTATKKPKAKKTSTKKSTSKKTKAKA